MATQQIINYDSSSSSSSSSCHSCVTSLKTHDVFLSFRGEDTRGNFTSHLHYALYQTKLDIYIDYSLQKGDEISQALIEAIQDSQISVVIFSEKYATSKWCLDEIAKIMECKENQGQIVIPVFYKIDPSHVRKQRGSFEQAFAEHEQDPNITKDKIKIWREALTKASNLAGWDSLTYRTEAEFIKDIVKDVLQKLNLIYPIELKGVIGIEENYGRIESLLEIGSREVRVIGIWGMGGIGKTTLAIALHAKLLSQFEAHCFLSNVREQSEKVGLDVVCRTLFSELFPGESLRAHVPKVESHFITRRLRRKRVFVVLDDVASSEQLEYLISDFDCLGPGSRVIVTTRDKHIFSHVDEIYEMEELNERHSLQLFCVNAFRENHPKIGFEELSKSVIAYCRGNPLALKVLGARLRSRSEQAWISELRKLQKIPNVKIHNVLKLSFDDLDSTEQDIFLDIACFLKGEYRDNVISLLDACNFFPAIGIEVLVDKSLITISPTQRIEMHDLIQEMGWNIVQQESIKDPGRRSRLWDPEEVYDVLKYNKGTEAIEGIILDLSKIEDLHLNFDSFTKMTNIRFLKLYDGKWSSICKIHFPKNGLESLSDKLRYLHWHGYCLESLPSTFSAKLLVELYMPHSNLQKLWDGVQNLVNLKDIDLRFCENLVEVPDLSMATNLKQLTLTECKSLHHIHPSILSLPKLQALDLMQRAGGMLCLGREKIRTEAEFIKDIVKDVLQKLNLIYPLELKGVIGIKGNYDRIESLLEIGSREVRVIGIWGMGGIGKTTLAIALYAKLFSQFEAHCFLQNVREQADKRGLDVLRTKLFSELFPGESLRAHVPKVESHFITRRLRRKRVFVVLDDVASSEQLEYLISDFDCLGPGSRVIVTTRDKHIFSHVDEIYEMEELNERHSLQLFCVNAFRENHPKIGFEELSKSVIAYCRGNPLALKVLGARLRSRSEQAWISELRKLQKIPNVKIHNVLKLCFDDLDRTEQDIFLDIACFLKGEYRDNVISLLDACNFFPAIGIEVLADKSLITISQKDTIEMHDLIQEMGWNIVQQESIKDPGRRSRLWDPKEVFDVLKYNKGTEAIQGIILDLSKIEDLHLSIDSFTKMTNIRFLKFYDGKTTGRCKIYLPKNGLKSLSDKLRYLHWHGYCLESLPSTFSAKSLVELSMPYSNVGRLWDGVQNLVNLKDIDLRFCENLVEVPDLSMATNLKVLTLTQCKSLLQVHSSILSLPKLHALDLEGCTKIESLQSSVHSKSLNVLRLSNCSSLKEFSVSSVELESLWLDGTRIQEFPSSIWRCAKLYLINIEGCQNLNSVGDKLSYDPRTASLDRLVLSGCNQINASNLHFIIDGMQSLEMLWLENCCNLRTLPDSISLLSSLEYLQLSGSNVESLPASIKKLSMLRRLYLDNCMELVHLPELPQFLWLLTAANCTSLVTNFTQLNITFQIQPSRVFEGPQSVFLPGDYIPDRFSFRAEGASVTILHLPPAGLCGFVFCLVLSESSLHGGRRYVHCFIYKNYKSIGQENTTLDYKYLNSDHVFLWFVDITRGDNSMHRRLQKGGACDPCNISFEFFFEDENKELRMEGIKRCAVYPIYASELKVLESESELGDSSRDIVELEPNASNEIDELQVKGSNHDKEDDHTKKLQDAMHQMITTDFQLVEVDSNETSSCDSVIVSTVGVTKGKPQSFREDDYYISSIPENQIMPFDSPTASNVDSNQTIELLEEKDLTYNQVDKCSEQVMFEKVYALEENDNLHHESDWGSIAELESMLCDSYKNFPMSNLSTTVSETEVQGPKAILEKLETLLETSLETISSDDEVKQQFHQVLDQLVQLEDQFPVKPCPVIYELKTFIEGVDVGFVTAQKTIQDYDQLLQSRYLLSKHLESAKAQQCQIKSKVSEGKIQFEKINCEIVELEQKISVLVETRDNLKRDLHNCDVENNKLKTEVAKWVSEGKTVITTLKDSKTCYKVALTNKKKAEDEWADLRKTFVDKRF